MKKIQFLLLSGLLISFLSPISLEAQAIDGSLKIHVAPKERMLTEASEILISGAPPGSQITLEATLKDGGGQAWSSRAVFYADINGTVDISKDASLAGTYTGVDGEAIFWSMQPMTLDELKDVGLNKVNVESERLYPDFDGLGSTYDLRKNHVNVDFKASLGGKLKPEVEKRSVMNSQTVKLIGDGVKHSRISVGDLRGVLYEAPGEGPHPLAVVITGSAGGVNELKASLLASAGITTLALAHFNYPERPMSLKNIPLEYFSTAMSWLANRYGQKRVALLGDSRGGEGVLLIASTFPDQVSALIAGVPSNVVFAGVDIEDWQPVPAWTLNGKALPYVSWRFSENRPSDLWAESIEFRHVYMNDMTSLKADDPRIIQVEKIKSPILLISGGSDPVWASNIASEKIMERLNQNGFQYPAEHLEYEGAGHLVPYPMLVKGRALKTEKAYGMSLSLGGTPAGNSHAQTNAFKRTVQFIMLHESSED